MTKLAWPLEWKVLQDIYPVDSWTIESAQEVTEAEQHYDVWVHWHNEGIYIASTESTAQLVPSLSHCVGRCHKAQSGAAPGPSL